MGNRETGEVSFEANGQTWTLRYGANEMCRIEDHFDDSIVSIANKLQDEGGVKLTTLRQIFAFGLDKDLNMGDVGRLMDEIGIMKAGELIGQAFKLAFPDAGDGEPGKSKATAS